MNIMNFIKDELKVRVRFTDNKDIEINLEDTAMNLGFVERRWVSVKKDYVLDIKWNRVKKYCSEISQTEVSE